MWDSVIGFFDVNEYHISVQLCYSPALDDLKNVACLHHCFFKAMESHLGWVEEGMGFPCMVDWVGEDHQ